MPPRVKQSSSDTTETAELLRFPEAKLVRYNGNGGAVTLPESFRDYPVTVIDRNAFSGNTSVTELVFSSTNTTVEEYAFMNCTSLESVTIPENVVTFGDRVFSGCTSLKTVKMNSDIVSMPTIRISSACRRICSRAVPRLRSSR